MNKNILITPKIVLVSLLSACGGGGPAPPPAVDLSTPPPADASTPPDATSPTDMATAASCKGLLYCDNFESYTAGPVANAAKLGPWVATVGKTGETLAVDGTKPYTGTKSLHVTMPAGAAAQATLRQLSATGLVPGNDIYGRTMIYYSDSNGNGLALGVHSWLFAGYGSSTTPAGAVSMNLGGGATKYQLNYHPPLPATEESIQGGTQTAGAWHCVQWQWDGSGVKPADEAKVWVDGTLVLDVLASKQTWYFATPWTTFDFGFNHYQTLTNPVDVYLDDFALNNAMIPCP